MPLSYWMNMMKLVFFLFLVPFFLTHWHWVFRIPHYGEYGYCTVQHVNQGEYEYEERDDSHLGTYHQYGMHLVYKKISLPSSVFSPFGNNWPSIAVVSRLLAATTNTGTARNVAAAEFIILSKKLYNDKEGAHYHQWCIVPPSIYPNDNNNNIDDSSVTDKELCSPHQQKDESSIDKQYNPPEGIWTDTNNRTSVRVSCKDPFKSLTPSSSFGPFAGTSNSGGIMPDVRRNPNKQLPHQEQTPSHQGGSVHNRYILEVVQHPATTLLLVLNIGLAFVYWNTNTHPNCVSKIYSKFVACETGTTASSIGANTAATTVADLPYEIWRSFTGATAHFEPLHLGFNMMSLYALGMQLEGNVFDSVSFLLYNLALIPITTIIMVGLVSAQITYYNRAQRNDNDPSRVQSLQESSTVGYSGILFAWMVVASLEQPSTCPVFFAPDLCFETYSFWKFKVNAAPLVQLVFCQFIMPRVSFVGHLAGIFAGVALHWNMLPLDAAQPSVMMPAIFLTHLWKVRHIVPVVAYNQGRVHNSDDDGCNDIEENEDGTRDDKEDGFSKANPPTSAPSRRGQYNRNEFKKDRRAKRDRLYHCICATLRNAMIVIYGLGLVSFDPFGSIQCSHLLNLAFFGWAVASHKRLKQLTTWSSPRTHGTPAEIRFEQKRLGTLWRGYIFSSVLLVVTDAMSLSGWFVLRLVTFNTLHVHAAVWLLFLRGVIHSAAICLATKSLSDIGETGGGIFVHVFEFTVLENARVLGNAMFACLNKTSDSCDGEGHVLGHGRIPRTGNGGVSRAANQQRQQQQLSNIT